MTPDKPQAAGDMRHLLKDIAETLEAMDVHIDNTLYDKVRAFLESSPQPQGVDGECPICHRSGPSREMNCPHDAERLVSPTTPQEALAAAWASIDGRLPQFGADRKGEADPNAGHYEGYLEDAAEMIKRLEKRGFTINTAQPQPSGDAALRDVLAKSLMRWRMDSYGNWPQEAADAAINEQSNSEHHGDCTKEPWTCMRCECDAAYKQADEVAALSHPPSTGDELRRALDLLDALNHAEQWDKDSAAAIVLAKIKSALAQAQEGGGTHEPNREIVKGARALSRDPAASAHNLKGALKGMLSLYDALNATTFSARRPITKEGE